jgi:hypothetical protein
LYVSESVIFLEKYHSLPVTPSRDCITEARRLAGPRRVGPCGCRLCGCRLPPQGRGRRAAGGGRERGADRAARTGWARDERASRIGPAGSSHGGIRPVDSAQGCSAERTPLAERLARVECWTHRGQQGTAGRAVVPPGPWGLSTCRLRISRANQACVMGEGGGSGGPGPRPASSAGSIGASP